MIENDEVVVRQERRVAKAIGWWVTAVCWAGLGWLGRGFLPAKAPGESGMGMPPAGGPQVSVVTVQEEAVDAPISYIGHVEPIQDVELRAQIEGYVQAVHFKEGALVKAGELLFEIDPEQYQARVSLSRAQLAKAVAELDRAERFQKRLEASDTRGIMQADMDTARSSVAQGRAAVKQAEANLALAEIDLKHTRILAPIDGRIGRTIANVGDYVAPSLGSLARIVQVAPIRVVFSVTDRDYLRVREGIADAAIQDTLRIRLKLPTGTVMKETGVRDFEDNEMSVGTATLPVRVRFGNADGLLVPNGYVTVLIDQPEARRYPVVAQSALTADAEGFFLYVVTKESRAELRRVELGARLDGRVEIRKGLSAGERVVVDGVMKVRPGQPLLVASGSQPGAAQPAEDSGHEEAK